MPSAFAYYDAHSDIGITRNCNRRYAVTVGQAEAQAGGTIHDLGPPPAAAPEYPPREGVSSQVEGTWRSAQ